MVISDSVRHEQLYAALAKAESEIGRSINPTVVTRGAWRSKRAVPDSFVARVVEQPHIMVLGSEDDLS